MPRILNNPNFPTRSYGCFLLFNNFFLITLKKQNFFKLLPIIKRHAFQRSFAGLMAPELAI